MWVGGQMNGIPRTDFFSIECNKLFYMTQKSNMWRIKHDIWFRDWFLYVLDSGATNNLAEEVQKF